MKRTGFKQKKTVPMKRGTLKKKSPMKISVLQRKIWDECKRIVRATYPNTCYTCGAKGLAGSNWQTGHMWAKASLGAYLKYDLRVLRPQCLTCNYHQGGRGADFYKRMCEETTPEFMEQLQKDRQVTVEAYDFYVELLEKYKNL